MVALTDVLTVNVGSSSVKLAVIDEASAAVAQRSLPAPDVDLDKALAEAIALLPSFDAVGHRVVHGGERFTGPVLLDATSRDEIVGLADLAPLHQTAAVAAIDAMARLCPDVPSVACFDTAFHATLPRAAYTYAIPKEWREQFGLRRYGFHGLSHEYAAGRARSLADARRVVTCHLGAGASLAAVEDGRSVDTTMGFTPLEGLVMATRVGSVDPGLLLWLLRNADIDADDMEDALQQHSGMVALAGTSDMQAIETAASDGDLTAVSALEVYVHRLRAGIAAMAASMGGLDAIVFTGGVGEHSAMVRAEALSGLEFLGVAVDPARNSAVQADGEISADDSQVWAYVVTAREDAVIATQTRTVVGG